MTDQVFNVDDLRDVLTGARHLCLGEDGARAIAAARQCREMHKAHERQLGQWSGVLNRGRDQE